MNVKDIFDENKLAIQQESYTCGPVALLNVLQLKGDFTHSEEELAKRCHAKPKVGTTNKNLVKVAREIGLELLEERQNADISDIERHLDNGANVIVCYHHAYSGEGHYGVITEYDEQAFYSRDPACGLFRMRKKYFKKFWYGTESQQWFMALK